MATETANVAEVAAAPAVVKRLPKPDDAKLAADLQVLQSEVSALQEQSNQLRSQIDEKRAGQRGSQGAQKILRAKIKEIRAERDVVQQARAALFARRDAIRAERDANQAKGKAMRSSLKYRNVAEIDEKIRKLNLKQSTESLSLKEEKLVLKELEAMKAAKKTVAQYEAHMDGVKAGAGTAEGPELGSLISDKTAALREIGDRMGVVQAELKKLAPPPNTDKDVAALFAKREGLRTQIEEKRNAMRAMRGAHKTARDAWWEQQREVRKERDARRAAENAAYEEEKAKLRAEKEAELAKQKPWLAEIALCDQILTYLNGLAPKAAAAPVEESKAAPAPTTRTLRDGTVVRSMGKKKLEEEAPRGKKGKKKGKSNRDRNQKKDQAIRHTLEIISSFGLLKLSPPKSTSDVANSIVEVNAKKDYYDTLPRAVPKAKKEKKAAPAKEEGAPAAAEESKADAVPETEDKAEAAAPAAPAAPAAEVAPTPAEAAAADAAAATEKAAGDDLEEEPVMV